MLKGAILSGWGNKVSPTEISRHREQFLRMVAANAEFFPGAEQGKEGWVRPALGYALISSISDALVDKLRGSGSDENKASILELGKWSRGELKQKIGYSPHWFGTDPQMNESLKRFVSRGLLSGSGNELGVTQQLLNVLHRHAVEHYRIVTDKEPPSDWEEDAGAWMRFNNSVFEVFDTILSYWRKVRFEVNQTISQHRKNPSKKGSYTEDYMGAHPEFMVTLFAIGFAEDIDEWKIHQKVSKFGLTRFVMGPDAVTAAIGTLRENDILVKSADHRLTFSPKISELMADFFRAIDKNLPILNSE